VLLAALLTAGAPWLETLTSTRAPAAAVTAARQPGEALLCERFLVRGLTYYAHATPDVLARDAHPYFTPHPLPVIVGPGGLAAYVEAHGGALCLVETKAWPAFAAGVPAGWRATPLLSGTKSLFRIEPPAVATPTRPS
jgi:hypothetical protein